MILLCETGDHFRRAVAMLVDENDGAAMERLGAIDERKCLQRDMFRGNAARIPCGGHGFAFGEKKPMGRSRAARNPAGASRMTGMELTTTEAVAMSPCEPPGITRLMFGCPCNSMVSAGFLAPTYICSSR